MRIKHLLFMAATALFAFTACEDPVNGDDPENGGNGDANFWTTYQLAPKGVKTIVNDNFTDNYDSKGRLISSVSTWSTTTYTYNSAGYVSKIESEEDFNGTMVASTQKLEYDNGNKFCPLPIGPGKVFHIFEMGLTKGLSKVTFENEDYGTIVMEYKFKGDILTISTSGGKEILYDDSMVYDDIIIEYEGNYPRYTRDEHEFIGPITYQANGQFDTYVEGFFSWDSAYAGQVTMERTRTVNKNFKDKLLVEKEVSKYYNDGESSPWNIETIEYTYNDKGDETKQVITNTQAGSDCYEITYVYEYDSKGNWIKCTGTQRTTNRQGVEPRTWVTNRTITYY